jgi:hypothetical protein
LIQERANDAGSALYLTILGRTVARGEARPEALHPRVATVAVVLLRNEYVTRGISTAPDHVLIEIVDEVFVPLVRGRSTTVDNRPVPLSAGMPSADGQARTRGRP